MKPDQPWELKWDVMRDDGDCVLRRIRVSHGYIYRTDFFVVDTLNVYPEGMPVPRKYVHSTTCIVESNFP